MKDEELLAGMQTLLEIERDQSRQRFVGHVPAIEFFAAAADRIAQLTSVTDTEPSDDEPMGEFEPITEQVREAFIMGSDEDGSGGDFDLWLARHDREVAGRSVALAEAKADRVAYLETEHEQYEEWLSDAFTASDRWDDDTAFVDILCRFLEHYSKLDVEIDKARAEDDYDDTKPIWFRWDAESMQLVREVGPWRDAADIRAEANHG